MITYFRTNYKLLCIFLISLIIFYPSLNVFYTNDDFFFLKLSNASTFSGVLNFFNLIKGPDGFGMYRPLTTQIFYFLAWKVFNLNPFGLHVISFAVFFLVIYLVYRLALDLFKNEKVGLIAAFLYATSATHFAHLYYLATFQELGVTVFVLLSCLFFLKFLDHASWKNILISLTFFILSLMSKETGVATPALLCLIYFFKKYNKEIVFNFKKLILCLIPFVICLSFYLLIRIKSYGFAMGDTYIWNFSIKTFLNTLIWYLVWALNLPETLLDFIGPGLVVNPNLWLYWSKQIIPILVLFGIECSFLAYVLSKLLFKANKYTKLDLNNNSIFCGFWFLLTLLPVVFLPLHKFTFYLTLPLIGLVWRISYLFVKAKVSNFVLILFLICWTGASFLTIQHTIQTNWITQGEKISKKAYVFFQNNKSVGDRKQIVFVDTMQDSSLPWSPTNVFKVAISGNNFFKVFFPKLDNQIYFDLDNKTSKEKSYIITSRTFLGY